ncbi:hypothetical protein PCK2_000165 [Pneumocystis canis]|nr:hypothetical protein PCK2_000165 [Pneumocystis canis]
MYSNDAISTPLNESPFSIPSTISSIEPLGSPAIKSQNLPLNDQFRSSNLQDVYVSRSNTPDISIGKRKYVPSHLSQFPYRKSYTPDRSSPLASQPSFTARPTTSNLRKNSSPPNWFGGPSFGTPKMGSGRGKAGHKVQGEDAPPTESLYDVGSSIVRDLESSSPSSENKFNSTSDSSGWFKDASSKLSSSGSTSVILFGFPATLTSHVIAHFSRYGEILDHSATDNPISTGSNWLKVTYADEEAANKAVSSNGTIIGGTRQRVPSASLTSLRHMSFRNAGMHSHMSYGSSKNGSNVNSHRSLTGSASASITSNGNRCASGSGSGHSSVSSFERGGII